MAALEPGNFASAKQRQQHEDVVCDATVDCLVGGGEYLTGATGGRE